MSDAGIASMSGADIATLIEPQVFVDQPLPDFFGIPADALVVADIGGGDPGFRYFGPTPAALASAIADEHAWRTRVVHHAGAAFIGPGLGRVPLEGLDREADGRMPGGLGLALAAAFAVHGAWMVHGAAIDGPAGGILILGNSFAGKSTTAASALLAGYRMVGDDWLLLWANGGTIYVRTLRPFASLREESWQALSAMPGFPSGLWYTSGLRHNMVLDPSVSRLHQRVCRIDHVLHAEVDPEAERPWATTITPMEAPAALGRLMRAATPALFIGGLGQAAGALSQTASLLLRHCGQYATNFGRRLMPDPIVEWGAIRSELGTTPRKSPFPAST